MLEESEAGEEQGGRESLTEKLRENPYIVTTIVLGIVCMILLILTLRSGTTGGVISEDAAGEKLVSYLNALTGGGVSLVDVKSEGVFYEAVVNYQGRDISVYITKDGEYYTNQLTPITSRAVQEPTQQTQPSQETPKSDKPEVELFVMTHCPYGLQGEKGLLPVLKLLGDKIDGKIRFVHYFMHGDKEEQETYRQICIREEQSSRYLAYLECFLGEGDSETCLSEAKIDKTKLDNCVENKAEDYYASDSEISRGYGVEGSPTFVINGKEVRSARSSQALLTTICSAFNTEPEECGQEISSQNPSPGFGYSVSGGSSGGQC
jgi:protein-disulfide isomerase